MAAMFHAIQLPALHGQSIDYGALEQLFKEPVTTSVDGSPQRVSDVPATMEIITAEDIRRSGAKDIPGVLRHVGGIDILQWGVNNVDVGIRGYNQAYSPRILVLIDGRQVYADFYGFVPWAALPVELEMIRQIEVVKGPNSALFGFNAVGGVINIITYSPLYDKVNTISATGGTQHLAQGTVVVTRRVGEKGAIRYSAGGHVSDDFTTAIPTVEQSAPRKLQDRGEVNLESVFRLAPRVRLGLETSYVAAQLNEMGPAYVLNGGVRYGSESVISQLNADSHFGLFQIMGYTNWLRQMVPSGLVGEDIREHNRATVVEAHDIVTVGDRHVVRVAMEYRNNNVNTTPLTGANIHNQDISASGMWNWKIAPSLSLTNAFRLDNLFLGRSGYLPPGYPFTNSDWSRTFSKPGYSSGLVWKPSARDTTRVLVSLGTLLPSLNSSGAILAVSPLFKFSGTPLINPSTVLNYEVGWDHAAVFERLLFRGSVFHQRNSNLMSNGGDFRPSPTGPYFLTANVGNSDANGMEVGLRGTLPEQFRWGVNYRAEQIFDHLDQVPAGTTVFVDYQHTTPLHQVKANLGWTNHRWEMDGYLYYQSKNSGLQTPVPGVTELVPIPGYVSIDGRIAYKNAHGMTWSVSGQNLTHGSQVQTSGPAVERSVLSTLSIRFK
jgi:iron complex outermembrane receptor protein